MKTVSGVVFDLDGTLFDREKTLAAAMRAAFSEICAGDMAQVRRIAALAGLDVDAGRLGPDSVLRDGTTSQLAEALLVELPTMTAHALARRLGEASRAAAPVEATPLVPLMSELAGRGLALAVATNDTPEEACRLLREAGVFDAFAAILAAGAGYAPKPAPDMLRAFLDISGIPAAACVMVGDSPADLKAGRAAGMTCVGVLTGASRRHELVDHADAILPGIDTLPAWLDRQHGIATAA